jgi:hypothetical protein
LAGRNSRRSYIKAFEVQRAADTLQLRLELEIPLELGIKIFGTPNKQHFQILICIQKPFEAHTKLYHLFSLTFYYQIFLTTLRHNLHTTTSYVAELIYRLRG